MWKKENSGKKGSVRGMGNLPTKMKGKSKNSLTSRIINRTDWNQNLVKRINSNNLFINNRRTHKINKMYTTGGSPQTLKFSTNLRAKTALGLPQIAVRPVRRLN